MGAHAGLAGEYCEKIIRGRGMEFMGFTGIRMPDNYMVAYRMPSPEIAGEGSAPVFRLCTGQLRESGRVNRLRP